MKKIGVLGAGTWGMALARMLSNTGHDVMVWSAIEREIDEFNKLFSKRHSLGVFLFQLDWLTQLSHTIDVSCTSTVEINRLLELRNTLKFARFLAIDCMSDIIDFSYKYNELLEKLYTTMSSKSIARHNTKESEGNAKKE